MYSSLYIKAITWLLINHPYVFFWAFDLVSNHIFVIINESHEFFLLDSAGYAVKIQYIQLHERL